MKQTENKYLHRFGTILFWKLKNANHPITIKRYIQIKKIKIKTTTTGSIKCLSVLTLWLHHLVRECHTCTAESAHSDCSDHHMSAGLSCSDTTITISLATSHFIYTVDHPLHPNICTKKLLLNRTHTEQTIKRT